MKYLSIQEIKSLEKKAIFSGISELILMENAGQGASKYIIEHYPKTNYSKITIICGKGNNGGDGLVIARHLNSAGYTIKIILLEHQDELSPTALAMLKLLDNEIPLIYYKQNTKLLSETIMDSDLLIDAMLGTGINGAPLGQYGDTICACNLSGKPIIAIDIPSGINGDTGPISTIHINPVVTLTFIAKKLAMQKFKPIFGKSIEVIEIL